MTVLRMLILGVVLTGLAACEVPKPGDPDYDRYVQSKADRAERLYEGF